MIGIFFYVNAKQGSKYIKYIKAKKCFLKLEQPYV